MFNRLYPARSALAVAVAAALGATSATAQMLEEVVVTAQKREQNLQDVPVAVTAFSGAMLEQSGVRDMFELQNNAPGLQVDQSQSAGSSNFGIRGIFTSAQNFGLESSVGLYVDGIYRGRQSSMVNNLVDVASVEVLRGPQGTLFGRNTPAGAVSVFSVEPDHEGSGFFQVGAGNYGLVNASGAKSFSAIDDVLAFRLTGFLEQRDGYVNDVHAGDDVGNDRDRWGVRGQMLFTPSDALEVRVIADISEVDETCCIAGTYKNNLVATDLPPGTPPKTGSDQTLVDLGGTLIDEDDFYDYTSALSFLPSSESTDEGISVQIDWVPNELEYTSITSYRRFETNDYIDADFSDLDVLQRDDQLEQTQFSQEFRVNYVGDRLNFVTGLYYFRSELEGSSQLYVGEDTTPFVGAFGEAFPAGTGSLNISEQEHDSFAIFGQFDYSFTDALVLTAGMRWTKEEKQLKNTFTQDASDALDFSSPGWGFWLFPPLAPRDDVDTSLDDDRPTGTIKLSWFATESTMFYASYGTGYKSGGTNTDRIEASLPILFDAETSESAELGMKAEFPDQGLRLNVALHKTEVDDLQTIAFVGNGFALLNAGKADTYGAEVEATWQATDTLSFNLGYAYNKADFEDFDNGVCWTATPWHTDQPDPGDNGDGSCDRNGGRVAGNPENFLTLSANKDFNISSDMDLFLYGEYIYTGDTMTDTNNDPLKYQDAYSLVNLRAGLRYHPWDAELVAWGRNVFDEEYLATIYDMVIQDGKLGAYYREPSTFGVTLRKHF